MIRWTHVKTFNSPVPAPSTLRFLLAFYLGQLPLEDGWDGWNENAHRYRLKMVQWLEWECPQSHRFEHGVSSWRIIQKGVGVGLAGRGMERGWACSFKSAPSPVLCCCCRCRSQLLHHHKAFLPAAMFPTMMAMESPWYCKQLHILWSVDLITVSHHLNRTVAKTKVKTWNWEIAVTMVLWGTMD